MCPFCGGRGCLIGHGWYSRMELIPRYAIKYGTFYIYRYYCKETGQTLSMHPDFCHRVKRYLLEYVIFIISKNLLEGKSIYHLCKTEGLYYTTIKRWFRGFLANAEAKRLYLLPHSTSSPGSTFLRELLNMFFIKGKGNAARGAALGMVRLFEATACSLY